MNTRRNWCRPESCAGYRSLRECECIDSIIAEHCPGESADLPCQPGWLSLVDMSNANELIPQCEL